ncbi:unnamed protein product [Arabis nemorensis]|uniref:Uncharacterized protein n=1 Tax=Arabis nemorensis TaxID=586526 RepID=A0A565AV47_9BRAS|nr:unnamed protein product [Arabis nemorensis]
MFVVGASALDSSHFRTGVSADLPSEMTALVQTSPPLPPEPPDPLDPTEKSVALSPFHSISKLLHHLLWSISLDMTGSRSSCSGFSRRLRKPSPGCSSIYPRARDYVFHFQARRLMRPSPSPRSQLMSSCPAFHFLKMIHPSHSISPVLPELSSATASFSTVVKHYHRRTILVAFPTLNGTRSRSSMKCSRRLIFPSLGEYSLPLHPGPAYHRPFSDVTGTISTGKAYLQQNNIVSSMGHVALEFVGPGP